MNELYKKINYSADINYIVSQYIREYDITKANISVLFKYGAISLDKYNYLLKCSRDERQVTVGLMIRDNQKLGLILQEGIREARKAFIESNEIEEHEILSIKNDAIYVINKIAYEVEFDGITFSHKNVYTSFYRLNKLEFYYYYDKIFDLEKLDVKGMSNDALRWHENYIMEFLKVCFDSAQSEPIEETLDLIINFYNRYVALELDIGYYREFNSESVYVFKSEYSQVSRMKATILQEECKSELDISCNLNLLRDLFQYYAMIQNSNKRR